MNAKRKMIISITALGVVLLAAIVAVVAVLAAQSVTIKSSINVSYNADKIIGTVTAQYQVKNCEATNIGAGSWTFYGNETGTDATKEGSATNIVLSETNNYVDFIFTFTNDGDAAYTATLNLPESAKVVNLTITYVTLPDSVNADNLSFTVAKDTTETYKIRYSISNNDLDAKIDNSSFEWTLA